MLHEALSRGTYETLIIDSQLAVALLVRELHEAVLVGELARVEKLQRHLITIDADRHGHSRGHILAVAAALLVGSPDRLQGTESAEYAAVLDGRSATLAFADVQATVDWSQHSPIGIWRDAKALRLEELWRCSRYVSIYLERLGESARREFLGDLASRGLELSDFSGSVLGTGSRSAASVGVDTWCPDLVALRAVEAGVPAASRVEKMIGMCEGLDGQPGFRAMLLRLTKYLCMPPSETFTWGLGEPLWRDRRRRAAGYLYVGSREADMVREPLMRVESVECGIEVEPDEPMWRRFLEVGRELERMRTDEPASEDDLTLEWLANRCLRVLELRRNQGATAIAESEMLEKLLAEARWGAEPRSAVVLEGDSTPVRRTGICLVELCWRRSDSPDSSGSSDSSDGCRRALAFDLGLE